MDGQQIHDINKIKETAVQHFQTLLGTEDTGVRSDPPMLSIISQKTNKPGGSDGGDRNGTSRSHSQ